MSSLDRTTPTQTPSLAAASPAAAARRSLVSRLIARYVDGWTWYASVGSPPAPEPGYPASRLDVFATCSSVCAAVARAPRFGLLFGTAAGR